MHPSQSKIISFIVVLVVAGALVWYGGNLSVPGEKRQAEPVQGEGAPAEVMEAEEEFFEVSGEVVRVLPEESSFVLYDGFRGREFTVVVPENLQITKFEFPFDPATPPQDGQVTPRETLVGVADLQERDYTIVHSADNVAGKNTIDNPEFIQVLP